MNENHTQENHNEKSGTYPFGSFHYSDENKHDEYKKLCDAYDAVLGKNEEQEYEYKEPFSRKYFFQILVTCIIAFFAFLIVIATCSTESQQGQTVGFVTKFAKSGIVWKSWDLELNKSQTGMTSTANEIELSVDNDHEDQAVINVLDSAQKYGWKIQVDYQSRFLSNVLHNRGSSPKFISKIEVLDRDPVSAIKR